MLIIFDLDGVLVDTRDMHFNVLNQAIFESIGAKYCIDRDRHLRELDGLPTREKLKRLGMPERTRDEIAARKQELTQRAIENIQPNPLLRKLVQRLVDEHHQVAVASNSVRATIRLTLSRLGLEVPIIFSNEDVHEPKPSPEMYLRAMVAAGVGPHETVIIEDSPKGRSAAHRSGARVVPVLSPDDVTYERIMGAEGTKPPPWHSDMHVLVPMAGVGSRFTAAGYTFPKPLIEVDGKPMIQTVVENLGIEARFIFICQKEHVERYNLIQMLNLIAPKCFVMPIDGVTEGAACTALLADYLIDNDIPLLIANADQLMEWDPTAFYWWAENTDADGAILTFKNTHPKWSFARAEGGVVVEVAEKKPISDMATCGVYWWKRGSDFVASVKEMIERDDRVNGEFYIAPTFNYAIEDGASIVPWEVDGMWGLGTPEDLRTYLDR